MLPNAHAIIRVVGYFVNKDSRRRHIIFRLCKIISEHTGKNIAGVLFCDYRIAGNIGYFIANNVELNNTCINTILYTLYLNISAKLCKGR